MQDHRRWRRYGQPGGPRQGDLRLLIIARYSVGMSERSKSSADGRAERLAQALRENLRRRKAQSRDRQSGDDSDSAEAADGESADQ
jgi:hypothetical protein